MRIRRTGRVLFLLVCMAFASTTAVASDSWDHINQELLRPDGWQQIVQDSAFQLDEETVIGESGGKPLLEIAYGSYPSLDGSTVAVPMAIEFARQHLPMDDADIEGFVRFSTTHGAYAHLIGSQPNGTPQIMSKNAVLDETHPVDVILVTAPSDEETAMAEAQGVTLQLTPVCYDAFVFITHESNPVDSLTTEQIRAIYRGDIKNWAEVGGEDIPIVAYQREKNSGSQTAMETLVMQGEPLAAAQDIAVVWGMGGLIGRVGTYSNEQASLGYTYLYYIDTLYKDDGIKVLRIDDIAPTPQTLRDASYPYATNYFAVTRAGEESATGDRFVQWMVSEEGQRCIEQAGYIPVSPGL